MFTYFGIALPFLISVLLLDLVILKSRVVQSRDFWIVLGIMLGFTAVFDQLFTGLPIVFYDFSLTSGVKLWYAPIEDFTYTIAAVIGIGSVLNYVSRPSKKPIKD
ncbi:lycopene cyclase domain-containing protein [Candidatus Saccharibacteria bacterium]|nr:lycopene cyclase domain-containing protein [Candidatus Saccharibacteria bacterium]